MTADREKISFWELWDDFRSYTWSAFRADLFAGLNVALLAIPQGMAYAMVAGLPVASGLVTAVVAAIVAALFGSSRHLIIGPTNTIALIVGIGVSDVVYNNFRYIAAAEVLPLTLQLTVLVTLLAGAIQVIGGLFRLGRLTQLVSHSVATGYVTGIFLAVFIGQTFDILGMSVHLQGANLFQKFLYLIEHAPVAHLPTLLLGVSCIGAMLLLRRYAGRYFPGFIMIAGASLAAYGLGLSDQGVAIVSSGGSVSLTDWQSPPLIFSFALANDLLPTAFAVAILSMLDATAVGKTLAARSGQRLSSSQELVGLGLANIASALLGGMPSSASPARSIANFSNGARTRLAAVFSGLFVVAILAVAAPLIESVPIAALAALILVNATQLINFSHLRLCWRSTPSDRYVLLATIACCILFSMEIAFYFGVIVSITLYLQQAARPQLRPYKVRYRSSWRNGIFENTEELHKWIQVVQVNSELFFGAADLFQDTLKTMTDKEAKVIVLVLQNSNTLDATACLAIEQLHRYLSSSGRYLILSGINERIWGVLERSGLAEKLGRGNLFALENRPRRSVEYALERAVAILEREGAAECYKSPLRKRVVVPSDYQLELHEFIPH